MQQNWKPNVAIFLGGQMISLFGSSLVQFAITWHITLSTQSGFYMTLAIIFGFLPTFLLSPFAGVWADRYNRKILVAISDGSIALTTLLLALAIFFGQNSIWLLFLALGIRALGSAVQTPCVSAILPSIVPTEHLARINGLYGTAQSAISLLSPMVSAALLASMPFFSIFLIDVFTAVLGIGVLLLWVKVPTRSKASSNLLAEKSNYLAEMKLGLTYVWNTKYLKHFFLYLSVFYVMFCPVAFLTPLQATRNYNGGEFHLMAIEVAFSVGMLLGGGLITVWGGFPNRIHSMALATLTIALCTIALFIPVSFWLYLGIMALMGISMPVYGTPSMVFLQERVDPDYMGRVFGIMTMISTGLMPLGMLLFGPMADQITIEWLLLGTGLVMLFLTISFARNPSLLAVGLQKKEEEAPLLADKDSD